MRFALSVLELAEAVGQLKTLRLLNFVKAFCTDSRKINDLALTVDQAVGGSNPPSCTKYLGSVPGNLVLICRCSPSMPTARAKLPTAVVYRLQKQVVATTPSFVAGPGIDEIKAKSLEVADIVSRKLKSVRDCDASSLQIG